MKLQVISRILGLVLLVNAAFMAVSAVVSAIFGFDTGFSPLMLSAILTTTVGLFPLIFVKQTEGITAREGYVVVLLAWVLSCLFGSMPYILWGGNFGLVNAWYESVSGYTTTGSTILPNPEDLPKSLLFWRSCTHWLGGIGVVMFMLLVLPDTGTARFRLSKMEVTHFQKDRFQFRAKQTIRSIALVYFSLTLAETLLLWISGIGFFDSINHSLSTIATGGFSSRNGSVMAFNNPTAEWIIMVFMFLGGCHFGLLYLAFTGHPRPLLNNPVFKYYAFCMAVSGTLISLSLWASGDCNSFSQSVRYGFFQTISMATTTGLVNSNSNADPTFCIILLNLLSLQCACAGSTSGGIKSDRIRLFYAAIKSQMLKILHPRSVVPIRMGGQSIEEDVVRSAMLYILLYLVILGLGAIVLSITGLGPQESFSVSLSNIGNVGVSFGEIGNAVGNSNGLTAFAKIFSTLQMIIGRIEIMGFMVLFLIIARK